MNAHDAMSIRYQSTLEGIRPDNLGSHFESWPNPPSPEAHLRILQGSDFFVLAISPEGEVVGWISAISDGVSCAYIPHLGYCPTTMVWALELSLSGECSRSLGIFT